MNSYGIEEIQFDDRGLVPVVTQDAGTKQVLMLAYMNQEALRKTIETQKMHYYSRSRQTLWRKGETSGHYQTVKELFYDCDGDTLLALVEQEGAACHTGHKSCFYRSCFESETREGENENASSDPLMRLYGTVAHRREHPKEGSYTNYLLDKGIDKILKKVGEENAEVIIAAKNASKEEIVYETADLMYHVSVMMLHSGVTWEDIYAELEKRR